MTIISWSFNSIKEGKKINLLGIQVGKKHL